MVTSMSKNERCLICSSKNIMPLSGYYEKHQLVKCHACGFVFMERIPTAKELNDYYSEYSYTMENKLSPITAISYNALLDEFEKYRKTNKILDIGCGRGWFLEQARKRGWDVYGTEFSDAAIKLCESKGIHMKPGKVTANSFTAEEFDVITSFEVMEHINNPLEETSYIQKFLRKGGLFYCTTPNFNSYLRFYLKKDFNIILYPEHLSYYTRKTLTQLLQKQGFELSKFQITGISLNRMVRSKPTDNKIFAPKENKDEKLRQQINSKWYLGYAKRFVNYLLTTLGLGMTLKGYFIKQ